MAVRPGQDVASMQHGNVPDAMHPETAVAGLDAIERDDETRNITRLIRFIALFVAVPTITIGLAFFLYTPQDHVVHMAAFLGMGTIAVVVAFLAPKLAKKFTSAST